MKRVPKGTVEDLIREDINVVQMDTNFVIFIQDLLLQLPLVNCPPCPVECDVTSLLTSKEGLLHCPLFEQD